MFLIFFIRGKKIYHQQSSRVNENSSDSQAMPVL